MLEMGWITAILQLYSQVADLFGNVVKRINIRLFDLLARFHCILNLPRIWKSGLKYEGRFLLVKLVALHPLFLRIYAMKNSKQLFSNTF